jgi:hypothetical protein
MKNVDFVIEKLNSKKFKKNKSYSSREISSIIGTTSSTVVQTGALKDALTIHPEWKNEYGRMWIYVGNQIVSSVPSTSPKKQVIKTKPKRREISLFWGLISIR